MGKGKDARTKKAAAAMPTPMATVDAIRAF